MRIFDIWSKREYATGVTSSVSTRASDWPPKMTKPIARLVAEPTPFVHSASTLGRLVSLTKQSPRREVGRNGEPAWQSGRTPIRKEITEHGCGGFPGRPH